MGIYSTHILPLLLKKPIDFNVLFITKRQGTFSISVHTSTDAGTSPAFLDWGDGSPTEQIYSARSYSHSYLNAGEKTGRLSTNVPAVYLVSMNGQDLTYASLAVFNDLSGVVRLQDNLELTDVAYGESSGVITSWYDYNTALRRKDFSRYYQWGGEYRGYGCNQMEEILFPANSTSNVTGFQGQNCPKVPSMNLSGLKGAWSGLFMVNGCTLLENLTPADNMKNLTRFWADNTKLNQHFPFGPKIIAPDIRINNVGMSQANVNANINSIYTNAGVFPATAKTLQIHGTNAAPSGTALTQIADLRANYNWTITHS